MLAKLTVLSTFGFPYYQAVDSILGFDASGEYVVNTDNLFKYKLEGSDDTYYKYKLNKMDDSAPVFIMKVAETNAQVKTLAEATAASEFVKLPVYEGALTFNDLSDIDSTTDVYFKVKNITWANENVAGTACRILVSEGGFTTKAFFVDYNLDQLVDVADTGTTTTTTSSTSSTTEEGQQQG